MSVVAWNVQCIRDFCVDLFFFFFKQKTAYEMRISDWSSDVCSSDLLLEGESGSMQPGAAFSEVEISGLTADSRRVAAGYLFAALPGTRADGRAFIPQAIDKGAAAVLAPAGTLLPPAARAIDPLGMESGRAKVGKYG